MTESTRGSSGRGRGRGRGKGKSVSESANLDLFNMLETKKNSDPATAVATAVASEKTSKKRQFPVVAIVSPDGIEGSLMARTRQPLIVHLPIHSTDMSIQSFDDDENTNDGVCLKYNPQLPDAQPYDIHSDNPFHDDQEQFTSTTPFVSDTAANVDKCIESDRISVSMGNDNNNDTITINNINHIDYYNNNNINLLNDPKATLLVQFKESSEIRQIPESSTSACLWCCHTFTHRPVVLPIRDNSEYLLVSGNYCSPECATSFLFDMRQDSHTRWEQFSLLHRVYGEVCGGTIYPAPPRTILKLFGGPLSILQYRALIQSHKVRIDVHLPPMVSILATMDTKPIDFYDSGLTKNITDTVSQRLQKAEEVLRLKRTKPLKAFESTLDASLNLRIRHTQ
jgi:hypothetical protein